MVRGRHEGGPGRYWLAGAAAGVALLAVAVGGLWLNERGDEPLRVAGAATPSVTASATTPPAPTPSASARAVPAALRDCAASVEAAEEAVAEARTGAAHWRRHVKAYRDVVDGRIPYSAADREWRVTRDAGPGDVKRFSQAETAYDRAEADCDGADEEAGPELSAAAETCAERMDAAVKAMSSGRRVMAQWDGHLDAMAAQMSHRLSDSRARVLFRAAVRGAPDRLEALEQAVEDLEQAPACRLPES